VLPRITQGDALVRLELAVLEVEHMDYFVRGSTAVKAGAAARELQAVECLGNRRTGHHLRFFQVHDRNLLPPVAAVQDRGEPPLRMQSDVQGEVSPRATCAELQAARRFLVRHFILTVECSTSHIQSGSVEATGRAPTVGPLHCMEVPFHLCT